MDSVDASVVEALRTQAEKYSTGELIDKADFSEFLHIMVPYTFHQAGLKLEDHYHPALTIAGLLSNQLVYGENWKTPRFSR